MQAGSNFEIFLSEPDGAIVPGSARVGHNVFTDIGRVWLSKVVGWYSLGSISPASGADASVPTGDQRVRWIGLGSGFQPEQVGVQRLMAPLQLTNTPTYIKVVGTLSKPTPFSVRYTTVFSGSDFAHLGSSVVISEAGILVDRNAGSGASLLASVVTNPVVAYKSFTPITKFTAQTLTVIWEFRF